LYATFSRSLAESNSGAGTGSGERGLWPRLSPLFLRRDIKPNLTCSSPINPKTLPLTYYLTLVLLCPAHTNRDLGPVKKLNISINTLRDPYFLYRPGTRQANKKIYDTLKKKSFPVVDDSSLARHGRV